MLQEGVEQPLLGGSPSCARPGAPRLGQCQNPGAGLLRGRGGATDRLGHELDNGVGIARAVQIECARVPLPLGHHRGGDGDRHLPGEAAPAHNGVDERAPHPPVPVDEGVDALELGVGDGGLRQGGKVLSPEEDDEVVDVGGDLIGGRRDVDGAAGRVVGAADPVLDAAQTTDLFVDVGRERRQEGSVGREEIIRFEVAPVRDAAECAGRVPRGGDEAGVDMNPDAERGGRNHVEGGVDGLDPGGGDHLAPHEEVRDRRQDGAAARRSAFEPGERERGLLDGPLDGLPQCRRAMGDARGDGGPVTRQGAIGARSPAARHPGQGAGRPHRPGHRRPPLSARQAPPRRNSGAAIPG